MQAGGRLPFSILFTGAPDGKFLRQKAGKAKDEESVDQPAEQQVDQAADESSEGIPVSEETRGNRVEEKIENRASKKQEMREEAKSIAGAEPHHDPRNESPDSGPAPLDRY